ncbi:MAG: hypothetical protein V9E83_09415 [Baekduia sp.]
MLLIVVICWLIVSLVVVALCVMAARADAEPARDVLPLGTAPVVRRIVRH